MDVASWLRGLGLEQYEQAFRKNDIVAEVLLHLTAEDLIAIGVTSVGHRRVLLEAIAALASAARPPEVALGTTLATAATVRPIAERRQLTVMFCDLVESTALASRLDPEDLREVIGAYHRCVAETIGRYDGFVAKYMGDGVLVYFGWPRAHEDDAERAVRAGLELLVTVSQLAAADATALAVHVGIATGQVVVGDLIGEGAAQEEVVVGETPNLAARLQTLAAPNEVMIGSGTHRLVAGLFELEDLGAHELKGFGEKVQAWRVRGESHVESRFAARSATGLTPFIGRQHELGMLLDRFERARAGEGQVVLLSGEPGIGKSRITLALRERLHGIEHLSLRYYGSPYHSNSALFPVIGQIERAAGVMRDDTAHQKLAKLEALPGLTATDAEGAARLVADHLAIPIGGRYPMLELTPDQKKAKMLELMLNQLEGLADRQPVLMIAEDAHWFDPTSLEWFDLVVDRIDRLPILLVVTFRPEFAPRWAGRPHVTLLTLNRLARTEGTALISQLASGKPLPNDVLAHILAKTEGVPLFVEELTKAVLESGILQEATEHYELTSPVHFLPIPSTLQDSLMARLDRQAPAKEVAQIGAVIGREFSYDLLAAVADLDTVKLAAGLDELVRAELVFRHGAPPQVSYAFKHVLVQDAAYGSLLKSKRQQIHRRIAEVLEKRFPETAEAEPEALARHLTEAGESERAIDYWLRAGQRAAERSANLEAIAHLRKGLDLLGTLPDTPERARRELALQASIGMPLIATKGYAAPETGAAYNRSRELCDRLGDAAQLLPILYGQWAYHTTRGDLLAARSMAETFLRAAEGQGAEGPALVARRVVGINLFHLGELTASRAHLEQALALYEANRHRSLTFQYGADQRSAGLAWLALNLWLLGYPDQAVRARDDAIGRAHEAAHAITLAHALRIGGLLVDAVLRDWRSAQEHAEALRLFAEQQRLPFWLAWAKFIYARSLFEQEPSPAAVAQMHEALIEILANHRVERPILLTMLAEAYGHLGQVEMGLNLVREALALVEETGERCWEAEIHRARGNLLAFDNSTGTVAVGCFERAIAVACRQGAKSLELRAATSLGRLWLDQGKRQQAYDLLAPIYGWFTEGLETADLKDATALLDEMGK